MGDIHTLITLRHEQRLPEALALGTELLTFLPNLVRLLEEMTLVYYFSGHKREAYRCAERILLLRPLDTDVLSRARYNIRLMSDLYSSEAWSPTKDLSLTQSPDRQIILTVTTCKRLNLFQRTMDSFLRSCVDLNWIHTFVCVDDNSSDEDRRVMSTKYPFFRFIWKSKESKGHSKSMQMLTSWLHSHHTKPRMVVHLEDDWEFMSGFSLHNLIEILYEGYHEGVRQVAFNRNYAELPTQTILGGDERRTQSNLMYYIHEHVETDEQRAAFDLKHGIGMTCHYWPHFTLQPSIYCYEILRDLTFEEGPSFEMAFARKYTSKGWKTAFPQMSLTKHIGKLLKDTDPLSKNAYQLNNENR